MSFAGPLTIYPAETTVVIEETGSVTVYPSVTRVTVEESGSVSVYPIESPVTVNQTADLTVYPVEMPVEIIGSVGPQGPQGDTGPQGPMTLNYVNVKEFTYDGDDYAAAGDGVTNDTATVQAAMLHMRAIDARGIYFPTGTYLLDASEAGGTAVIHLLDGEELIGDGIGKTTLKLRAASVDDAWSSVRFITSEGDYSVIRDLSVDGSRDTITATVIASTLIRVVDAISPRIENVTVYGQHADESETAITAIAINATDPSLTDVTSPGHIITTGSRAWITGVTGNNPSIKGDHLVTNVAGDVVTIEFETTTAGTGGTIQLNPTQRLEGFGVAVNSCTAPVLRNLHVYDCDGSGISVAGPIFGADINTYDTPTTDAILDTITTHDCGWSGVTFYGALRPSLTNVRSYNNAGAGVNMEWTIGARVQGVSYDNEKNGVRNIGYCDDIQVDMVCYGNEISDYNAVGGSRVMSSITYVGIAQEVRFLSGCDFRSTYNINASPSTSPTDGFSIPRFIYETPQAVDWSWRPLGGSATNTTRIRAFQEFPTARGVRRIGLPTFDQTLSTSIRWTPQAGATSAAVAGTEGDGFTRGTPFTATLDNTGTTGFQGFRITAPSNGVFILRGEFKALDAMTLVMGFRNNHGGASQGEFHPATWFLLKNDDLDVVHTYEIVSIMRQGETYQLGIESQTEAVVQVVLTAPELIVIEEYGDTITTYRDRTTTWGVGTPEGVVTATIGSLYYRIDGGTSTTLYVKTSGTSSTGWTAK